MWEIHGTASKGEYTYARVPEHPKATALGYVLEHRIVVENDLNRLLEDDEIIHHINGVRKDNRVENLQVLSQSEHMSLHSSSKGREYVRLKCPICNIIFEITKNKSFLIPSRTMKANCCSRSCGGKLGIMTYKGEYPPSVLQGIEECLIEEFHKYPNAS